MMTDATLDSLPDFFSISGLLKATPRTEHGERFVFLEASNKTVDQQGERVLAQAPAHSADRRQAQWMACGRWHHDVQMTLHASQEPALVAGLPTPLTLDATQITPTPAFARLSTAAQAWLIRLTGDPLALSASLAAEGWTTLATGLWITPP